jgi:hypothetical protein
MKIIFLIMSEKQERGTNAEVDQKLKKVWLVEVTGNRDPLPTTIVVGLEREGGWMDKRLLKSKVMSLLTPVSMYHSPVSSGVRDMVWKVLASAGWSQTTPDGEGMP